MRNFVFCCCSFFISLRWIYFWHKSFFLLHHETLWERQWESSGPTSSESLPPPHSEKSFQLYFEHRASEIRPLFLFEIYCALWQYNKLEGDYIFSFLVAACGENSDQISVYCWKLFSQQRELCTLALKFVAPLKGWLSDDCLKRTVFNPMERCFELMGLRTENDVFKLTAVINLNFMTKRILTNLMTLHPSQVI